MAPTLYLKVGASAVCGGIRACDGDVACGAAAVQINGVDVRTREQAIQMFAESRDEITLLLARPFTQVTHALCTVL